MKGKRFNGNRTCVSLAEELGLHPNTVYKWVQQYTADPEQAFPGSGNVKSDEKEMLIKIRRSIVNVEIE